jgi:hypothetical protein
LIRTLLHDLPLLEEDDLVNVREEVKLVGDENASLASKRALDGVEEESLADVGVYRTERVVEEDDGRVRVQKSSDRDSLPLTS